MKNEIRNIVADAKEWNKKPLNMRIGSILAGTGAMAIILTCLAKIG